jgi:hypothetical protein
MYSARYEYILPTVQLILGTWSVAQSSFDHGKKGSATQFSAVTFPGGCCTVGAFGAPHTNPTSAIKQHDAPSSVCCHGNLLPTMHGHLGTGTPSMNAENLEAQRLFPGHCKMEQLQHQLAHDPSRELWTAAGGKA